MVKIEGDTPTEIKSAIDFLCKKLIKVRKKSSLFPMIGKQSIALSASYLRLLLKNINKKRGIKIPLQQTITLKLLLTNSQSSGLSGLVVRKNGKSSGTRASPLFFPNFSWSKPTEP
jgi:hypothetical protein